LFEQKFDFFARLTFSAFKLIFSRAMTKESEDREDDFEANLESDDVQKPFLTEGGPLEEQKVNSIFNQLMKFFRTIYSRAGSSNAFLSSFSLQYRSSILFLYELRIRSR
jgi:hypothetical protein